MSSCYTTLRTCQGKVTKFIQKAQISRIFIQTLVSGRTMIYVCDHTSHIVRDFLSAGDVNQVSPLIRHPREDIYPTLKTSRAVQKTLFLHRATDKKEAINF